MSEVEYEIVPGMATHIERRMEQLRMSPTGLADATQLSLTVLAHVRAGYRKRYQQKLKWAVCRALRWTPNSIDLMLAGKPPVELSGNEPAPPVPLSPVDALEVEVKRLAAESAQLAALLEETRQMTAETQRTLAEIQRLLASTPSEPKRRAR